MTSARSLSWLLLCLQLCQAGTEVELMVQQRRQLNTRNTSNAVLPNLHQHTKRFSGLYTGPYFDSSTATNITAQLGTHAYLPCRIKQLGNKSEAIERARSMRTVKPSLSELHNLCFPKDDSPESIDGASNRFKNKLGGLTHSAKTKTARLEVCHNIYTATENVLEVSWIRRRDAHILTVDRYTFIADDRFQAFLVEATDTWTLQIKYVQARDAGQYECQVSTENKMSHFITLNVVVPHVEVVGGPDLYVRAGSTVALRCEVTQSLEEPAYIFWYHEGERVLSYKDIRVERVGPDTTVSTLLIHRARRDQSGNYTCKPSNLDSASVLLHVLDGEHPAAMQRGKNSAPADCWWSCLCSRLALALGAMLPTRSSAIGVLLLVLVAWTSA